MGTRLRTALACLSCRSLHARCDGNIPTCTRCKEELRVCQYPKSRRRRTLAYPSPSSSDILGIRNTLLYEASYAMQPAGVRSCETVSLPIEATGSRAQDMAIIHTVSTDGVEQPIINSDSHELMGSYYRFFHKAHPFAPTKAYVWSQIESDDASIRPLFVTMCYVGSMYRKSGPRKDLEQLALQILQPPQAPSLPVNVSPSGIYRVAALLLLAIAAHGQAELERASDLLDVGISICVNIGMNCVDEVNSCQDKELAELWKRTNWYLYIMESALTGKDGDSRFDPGSTFPLPCEKDVSQPATLAHFDMADFDDDSRVFSSLTYSIALARAGRSIKRICEQSKDRLDRAMVRADALLMNWKLHLPSDKQQVFNANGEVDDVMFQSHILFHSLRIYVHTSQAAKMGPSSELLHRRKKLEAVEAAVSLLTLHPCLLQMSPLTIAPLSGIAMSNICATLYTESDSGAKENLRLVLGVLKQLGEAWTAASREAQALKAMARLTYSELGNHAQETRANINQASPRDILPGDVSCPAPGMGSPARNGEDVGMAAYGSHGSLDIPFPESAVGSPEDLYVFSWDS